MGATDFPQVDLMNRFRALGARIRKGEVDVGRHHYALPLAHAVNIAIHSGYHRFSAVELGVGQGEGLFDLCKAAAFLREEFSVEIDVWGFDNGTGLDSATDYRDHPEIWSNGQFCMENPAEIEDRLPHFAKLVIGDVRDSLKNFLNTLDSSPLGFIAMDLDYYSSTIAALKILLQPPEHYLPCIPTYVDDVEVLISYNPWCGEAAAISEFNTQHQFRKIERKHNFGIHNFHVCHVLDHPIRTGTMKPAYPFEIRPI